VLYVGDEAEKQAPLLGEPEVFFTTPVYDGLPLVMLRLERVDVDRIRELVVDAWRMRALTRLSATSTTTPICRAQARGRAASIGSSGQRAGGWVETRNGGSTRKVCTALSDAAVVEIILVDVCAV
jgi:hypothetical protein